MKKLPLLFALILAAGLNIGCGDLSDTDNQKIADAVSQAVSQNYSNTATPASVRSMAPSSYDYSTTISISNFKADNGVTVSGTFDVSVKYTTLSNFTVTSNGTFNVTYDGDEYECKATTTTGITIANSTITYASSGTYDVDGNKFEYSVSDTMSYTEAN